MLTIHEEPVVVTPPDVAAIIDATQPTGIRVDEVHAGPVHRVPDVMKAGIVASESAFAQLPDNNVLLVRITHTLSCQNETDEEVASVNVAHIASFTVLADLETSRAAVSAWIDANVYFMVYPYVRQFFTEITATLGLPPVVLDYLRRDDRQLSTSSTDASQESPAGLGAPCRNT